MISIEERRRIREEADRLGCQAAIGLNAEGRLAFLHDEVPRLLDEVERLRVALERCQGDVPGVLEENVALRAERDEAVRVLGEMRMEG